MVNKTKNNDLDDATIRAIVAADMTLLLGLTGTADYMHGKKIDQNHKRQQDWYETQRNQGYKPSGQPSTTQKQYSDSEIAKFVDKNIKFVEGDTAIKAHSNRIKTLCYENIKALPAWQQTLIIEGNRPILIGQDFQTVQRQAGGIFRPQHNDIRVRHHGAERGSGGSRYDEHFKRTFNHEKGHEFGWNAKSSPGTFWEEENANWKKAIEKEVASRGPQHRSVIAGVSQEFKGLGEHLKAKKSDGTPYYTPAQYPQEALAEMNATYAKVHNMHKGNWKAIDHFMSRSYPHAWPVYRDEFIPHMQSQARNLNPHIDTHVDPKARVADMNPKYFMDQSKTVHLDFPKGTTERQIAAYCEHHGISRTDAVEAPFESQNRATGEKHVTLSIKPGTEGARTAKTAVEHTSTRLSATNAVNTAARPPEPEAPIKPGKTNALGKAAAVNGLTNAGASIVRGDYIQASGDLTSAGLGLKGLNLTASAVQVITTGLQTYANTGDGDKAIAAAARTGATTAEIALAMTAITNFAANTTGAVVAFKGGTDAAIVAATARGGSIANGVAGRVIAPIAAGLAVNEVAKALSAELMKSGDIHDKLQIGSGTYTSNQTNDNGTPRLSNFSYKELAQLAMDIPGAKDPHPNPKLAEMGIKKFQDPTLIREQMRAKVDEINAMPEKTGSWLSRIFAGSDRNETRGVALMNTHTAYKQFENYEKQYNEWMQKHGQNVTYNHPDNMEKAKHQAQPAAQQYHASNQAPAQPHAQQPHSHQHHGGAGPKR